MIKHSRLSFRRSVYPAGFEPVVLDSFEDAGRYVVAFNEQERFEACCGIILFCAKWLS
jgi:hypothetical protein